MPWCTAWDGSLACPSKEHTLTKDGSLPGIIQSKDENPGLTVPKVAEQSGGFSAVVRMSFVHR